MNIQHLIEGYLFELYQISQFKRKLHLQGGAAISLVFKFDRIFSNDLDFTAEDKNTLIPLKLNGDNKRFYSTRFEDGNKITILYKNSELFHIDIYVVDPSICEYTFHKYVFHNKVIFVNSHSLNDLLAEKIYCTMQRTELRDLMDIQLICESDKIDIPKLNYLYLIKKIIKKPTVGSLQDYINCKEEIRSKFLKKFPKNKDDIDKSLNQVIKKFSFG